MFEVDGRAEAAARVALVSVEVGGQKVLIAAASDGSAVSGSAPGVEREVSGRVGPPRLEQVLDGLAVFATEIAARMRTTDATRVGVEFGCDIAMESGSLVAVIGKASAASSIKVSLEWSGPGR